jgi:glyoxylase-like metal-dependent hydrolase (beta-lactamase superfamily II)
MKTQSLLGIFLCMLVQINLQSPCYDRNNVLPIPENSKSPIKPGAEYLVDKITKEQGEEGVYWGTDGGYSFMFVVHKNGVVVVDAPWNNGWAIKAIREKTKRDITHFIYSHYHTDHTGDANLIIDPVNTKKIIAQAETTSFLKARSNEPNSLHLPVPNISFVDKYKFKVDDFAFELSYTDNAHVKGNTIIYLPNQKIIMHIDIVVLRWGHFERLGEMENTNIYLKNLNEILSYDFDYFVIF